MYSPQTRLRLITQDRYWSCIIASKCIKYKCMWGMQWRPSRGWISLDFLHAQHIVQFGGDKLSVILETPCKRLSSHVYALLTHRDFVLQSAQVPQVNISLLMDAKKNHKLYLWLWIIYPHLKCWQACWRLDSWRASCLDMVRKLRWDIGFHYHSSEKWSEAKMLIMRQSY